MPFRYDERTTINARRSVGIEQFEDDDATIKEVAVAAFGLENTIGSLIAKNNGLPDSVVDNPDFNPFSLMTEDERLDEVFVSNAALADNEDELNAVRKQSEEERRKREIISRGGAMAVPITIGVSVIDPVNLIPVGGASYRTYKTGGSILSGAMATGSAATASTLLTEAALHATQLERTYGESAINLGGAALLGGTIGALSARLSEGFNLKQIDDEINDSMNVEPKIRDGVDSVGAARASQDVEIKGRAAKVLSKVFAWDPLTRTLSSDASPTRRIANELAENPIEMDGEVVQAVESFIKIHDGKYAKALEEHLSNYTELQSELGGATGLKRLINRSGMSRAEFNEAVAKELRNPSDNALPQVKRAAEAWNRELYEPLKKDLIEQKLLPEDVDVTTATNYLNRVWNKEKIAANYPAFIDKVSKWLRDTDQELFAKARRLREELKALDQVADAARIKEINEQISKAEYKEGLDLEPQEYDDIARQIAQRISGTPDGRLPYDFKLGEGSKGHAINGTKVKGPLKSRTFNIPDKLVEEFLENDIEVLGGRYLKQVAPDLELTRRFGDIEMKAQLKEIEDYYNSEMAKYSQLARKGSGAKKRLNLAKQKDKDIADIAAMRDRIRGVYGNVDFNNPWTRAGRAIRDLNYLRFMGGVVASSVPDIARIFMAEGFVNTFKNGLNPLVSKTKGFKVAASEAKRYGVGVDTLMGGRSEIIADIADYTQGGTAIERGIRSAAAKFGQVNLMDYWTSGVKQLHAVTMQNTVIDELMKGTINKKLKRLGIDDDHARLIAKELKKHGKKIDGVWISNAKNWDDPELERIWGAAIRKESDRVIVVPGQEKPLFMSSEMGKTIFQFRSFMFSATQRMLIAGIQGQEANYLGGMLMLTSLGMMSYAFKQWDAGREISDDPAVWITEGIDRSGALGALMEINNTVEKISNNNFGLRRLLGASAPASRFASRSQLEAMMGPTFGSFLSTALQVAAAGTDANEWKDSDTRALRRLIPYQNLTIIRQLFDKIEKSIQ